MKRSDEEGLHGAGINARIDRILDAMNRCIPRGLTQECILPGGLNIRGRAKAIHGQLQSKRGRDQSQPAGLPIPWPGRAAVPRRAGQS